MEILAEVREVLRRDKIRKYHDWTDEEIDNFVAFLYTQSVITEGKLTVNRIARDFADNKFLACAQEGGANYLVSGDSHLIDIQAFEGTQIITPAAFLAVLRSL